MIGMSDSKFQIEVQYLIRKEKLKEYQDQAVAESGLTFKKGGDNKPYQLAKRKGRDNYRAWVATLMPEHIAKKVWRCEDLAKATFDKLPQESREVLHVQEFYSISLW